ncbi:DUF1707 domain-containing protein [Streptomyces sp. NPDC059649]|uniref:DUF1707 SHOCT-like domain-containing protein n=1 Tax=Streptomyces sp. NPDC059649 TaxID=3346895 RepID=UPI0036AAC715
MTRLPQDPTGPVSEEDRDMAVLRLQEAYTEGHLSYEDMDQRLGQLLKAKTQGQLASAVGELPEVARSQDPHPPVMALQGSIRRRGRWRVPRRLTVASALGRVRLDLSRAVFEHPAVDIELAMGTGRARIIVPRDAVVDLKDLQAQWKYPNYKARTPAGPGGVRIRIHGVMGMGRLTIRHTWR